MTTSAENTKSNEGLARFRRLGEKARYGLAWLAWKGGGAVVTVGGVGIAAYELLNLSSLLFLGSQVPPNEIGDAIRSIKFPDWAQSVGHVATGAAATATETVAFAPHWLGEQTDNEGSQAFVAALGAITGGAIATLGIDAAKQEP